MKFIKNHPILSFYSITILLTGFLFMDEPDVEYYFTLENGKIVGAGVSGESPDKSELK